MRCCLLIFNLESGGAERHLVQLARHWPQAKGELEVVLFEREGSWLDELPQEVPVHALADRAPAGMALKIFWTACLIFPLRRLLHKRRYDVILSFLWLPTVIAALALKGLPAERRPQLIWSVQSDLERDFRLHRDGSLRHWVVKAVLPQRVDHYIAISHGISERTQRLLGVPKERFMVIPNSIDLARIREMATRRQANVPPKLAKKRLISVGRLHPAKGFKPLLEALMLVQKHLPDFECLIVGEGPERLRLEKLIGKLGLSHRVQLMGFASNPYAYMASADVFVSSSRWEAFGITIAEALALGLPVVATATDGAREIITHGDDGLLVPPDDPEALADGIVRLLEDEELSRRLGEHASLKATRFDTSLITRHYAEAMQWILKDSP